MRRKKPRLKERLSRPDGRVPIETAERWAYRDEHTRQVYEAIQRWDADHECVHGRLPADTPTCGCWDELTVREAEALRHDIQLLAKTLERHHEEFHEAIRTLTDVLQHLDRNVTAVGYQVTQAGDNGR